MTAIHRLIVLVLLFGFGLNRTENLLADEELVWSGPGCVLLKNGNVLTGTDVKPEAKQVAIRLDQTASVHVPNTDVVAIGRDKLGLYQYQTSKTPRWGAGEHLHFAKWCLRHGLVEQSQVHYEELRRMSGDHAKFKQLDSEIKEALLQDPIMQAAINAAYPNYSLTKHDSSNATTAATNVPSSKPIDLYSQEHFRQKLLPFLAMRCGQAGCHGAFSKSDFHIAKSGNLHGRPATEVSHTSASQFLDDKNVEATTFWLKATTKHGMQTTSSLTDRNDVERELLNRIRQWHQIVYRDRTIPSPHLTPSEPQETLLTQQQEKVLSEPPKTDSPAIGNDLLELEREIAKLEEKERARKVENRHDPEQFNRRYAPVYPQNN